MKKNKILIKLIRHFAVYLIIIVFLSSVIGIPILVDQYSKATLGNSQLIFDFFIYVLGSFKFIVRSILIFGSFIIGTQILLILARYRKKLRFISK